MIATIAPRTRRARSTWLVTLADLALLLLGFLAMLAAAQDDAARQRLAAAVRTGFVGEERGSVTVESARIAGFAPGSLALPASAAGALDWLALAAADPRTIVVVSGSSDGTAADTAVGGPLATAAMRAEAVAGAIVAAGILPAARIRTEAQLAPGAAGRRVDLGIRYTNARKDEQ